MSDIDRKRAIEILKTKTLRPVPFDNSAESSQEIIDFYEALNLAISSLEADEAYQLLYERTTKNDLGVNAEDCISRPKAKEKKVYSEERHEYVIPIAEIDWLPSVYPKSDTLEKIQKVIDDFYNPNIVNDACDCFKKVREIMDDTD